MQNTDVILLLMVSKTIGFSNREVQGLLNDTLSVLVTNEQIDAIFRANEHKYVHYRKNLKTGRKTIPRRIIRYAKRNSIRIDIAEDNTLRYHDVAIISYALSIVMSRERIKKPSVAALVKDEFPEKSYDEINPIIDKLYVEGYSCVDEEFLKASANNEIPEFSRFVEGYGQVKVRDGHRTYFDRRTNDLAIKDSKIVEFLVLLLDRQNQYYSDEIQMEINKIDSLL